MAAAICWEIRFYWADLLMGNPASAFVDSFIGKTIEILKVFMGLFRSWQEQADIDVSVPAACGLFAEIDADYKCLVDDLFFEKGS